jgi:DUF4097 and DUF4098 domain-containing protein YvlB
MKKVNKQKHFLTICALSSFALSGQYALAGEKVDQTMDVDAKSYIEIEHINGRAEVKGWDKDQVQVRGELSDRAEEFIFERDGKQVRIEVEMKSSNRKGWGNWNSGDKGDDLVIYVPHGSFVSYTSVNASFEGTELHGGLTADVVNGAIDVNDITGRVRLESVNGNIDAAKLDGDVMIDTVNGSITGRHSGQGEIGFESVNGDIDIHSDSREIQAETVNGDIELQLDLVSELELSTVNGSIDVEMTLEDEGDVEVTTVGGSVSLIFQQGIEARFDIEGHAGGKFVNRLTNDKTQKAKYGPRRWLEFTTGDGSANVDVSTVNGRVELDSK